MDDEGDDSRDGLECKDGRESMEEEESEDSRDVLEYKDGRASMEEEESEDSKDSRESMANVVQVGVQPVALARILLVTVAFTAVLGRGNGRPCPYFVPKHQCKT